MVLPNFLICGAEKAGTTALHNYLKQHPDVFMSRPKETFFFDTHYNRGIEWFAKHFEAWDGEYAVGEGTPWTMSSRKAPARVAKHLPEARLLFVLRNPIDRAYSHYHFYIQTGKIEPNATFHEVVHNESSGFRKEMIGRGMYDEQLARFDRYFDCSQKKIILHEALLQRTTETVQGVYRFLRVNSTYTPQTSKRHNVTHYPGSLNLYHMIRTLWRPFRRATDAWFPETANALRRTVRNALFSKEKPKMRAEDRAYLREIYAEPNARLEERIGRDLSHWT